MNSFTACLTKNGAARIISVNARNEDEARTIIYAELDTPSRQFAIGQWRRSGGFIVETTDEFAQ